MNEENGGAGGAGYFAEAKDSLNKHFAAIESDLGASHPIGALFAGKPDVAQFLAPLSRVLQRQGSTQTQHQGAVGADTSLLTQAGVP